MYGQKPISDSLKCFGCTAHVHIGKLFRRKNDRTSQKGIFLGSSDNTKTHLIGIKDEKATFIIRKSRSVTFNKQKMFNNKSLSAGQTRLEEEADLNSIAFLSELINDNLIPKSTEEAIKDNNWFEAMQTEYNSLMKTTTGNL